MRRIAVFTALVLSIASVAAAEATRLTLSAEGSPAAIIVLPDGWKAKTEGVKTTISLPVRGTHIQLWPVAKAGKPDEAVPLVANLITEEVVGFKGETSKDITVAGSPAKHILGSGTEADDNDPSNVEVVLFSVGKRVFLACAHDDADGASRNRAAILSVLNTATVP